MPTIISGDTGVNQITAGAIEKADLPAGSVLQVVSTTKTDTFSFSGTSTWTNITGVSASITPTSASNKIFVSCVTMFGNTNSYNATMFAITRNGTRTPIGDSSGTKTSAFIGSDDWYTSGANSQQVALIYLDSPATTSSVTYQLQAGNFRDSETIYINRSQSDGDAQSARGVTTITLMEIAA
jgi:hypothetical protein